MPEQMRKSKIGAETPEQMRKSKLREEALKQLKKIANEEPEAIQEASEIIFKNLCGWEVFRQARAVFVYVSTELEVDTIELIRECFRIGKRVFVPRCLGAGIMEMVEISSLDQLVEGKYGLLEPPSSLGATSLSNLCRIMKTDHDYAHKKSQEQAHGQIWEQTHGQVCEQFQRQNQRQAKDGQEDIFLTIIPCIKASYSGHRLGHGGGYYDRFLKQLYGNKMHGNTSVTENDGADCPNFCNEQIACCILSFECVVDENIPVEAHDIPADYIATERGVFKRNEI